MKSNPVNFTTLSFMSLTLQTGSRRGKMKYNNTNTQSTFMINGLKTHADGNLCPGPGRGLLGQGDREGQGHGRGAPAEQEPCRITFLHFLEQFGCLSEVILKVCNL